VYLLIGSEKKLSDIDENVPIYATVACWSALRDLEKVTSAMVCLSDHLFATVIPDFGSGSVRFGIWPFFGNSAKSRSIKIPSWMLASPAAVCSVTDKTIEACQHLELWRSQLSFN